MKQLLAPLLLTAGLVIAAPASARGFDSTVTTKLSGPVKVEIVLSEGLAYRAENLPRDISDRSVGARFNAAFANNGKYGQRELDDLVQDMEDGLIKRFAKKGVVVSDTAPTLLRITLEDVRPNRPTFNQLSNDVSLSYQSVGTGRVELTADLIGAGGVSLGSMEYNWLGTDIRDSAYGGTWQDAKRGFGRFATKAAKVLN